jgi:peptide/nickel transport system substrate-binding protein
MRYRSRTTASEFDIGKANALLDAAGWKRGGTGIRAKSGKELSLLFQASTGTLTQKVQTIVKSAAQKAGVQIELKAIASSVYFSSDAGNPDMYAKFVADMQAYNVINESPDPESLMQAFVSWEVASKANKWSGLNVVRWQSEEFDALFRASESEMDPVRRAGLFIRMNDLLVSDGYIVPIVDRMTARALSHRLVAPLSGWQNDTAFLADWYRQS